MTVVWKRNERLQDRKTIGAEGWAVTMGTIRTSASIDKPGIQIGIVNSAVQWCKHDSFTTPKIKKSGVAWWYGGPALVPLACFHGILRHFLTKLSIEWTSEYMKTWQWGEKRGSAHPHPSFSCLSGKFHPLHYILAVSLLKKTLSVLNTILKRGRKSLRMHERCL